MTKYYFYYYFVNGRVCSACVTEDDGEVIGGKIYPIENCKWEITEQEFDEGDLFLLREKCPYPH